MAEAARNILIAIDRSDHSVHAFQWTLDNIIREGDHLYILFALEVNQWASLGTAGGGMLCIVVVIVMVRE
jgi:nucleotide-binding universal stress UspA family protein